MKLLTGPSLLVLTCFVLFHPSIPIEHVPSFDVSEYLKKSGNEQPRPPILLLPGLVSSRLVAWKRKVCRGPDINIQDIVWLNLQKMIETMTYDKNCWLDCMKLGKNGSDPADCKLRADEGLSAIGELSPGNLYTPPATSIFTALIKMLAAELGYDRNSMIGAGYDWRLAPIQLQQRDSYFKTLKQWIEVAVERHKRPAIVVAHSMGTNIFMYFCDWLRVHEKPSMGWEKWVRKHVWAYVGIAAPLLGSPGAIKSVMSGHTFGLSISEAQARELELTFSSTHFLNPRSSRGVGVLHTPNQNQNHNTQTQTQSQTQQQQQSLSGDQSLADYTEPIVTIKSASGSSNVSFGIRDIENGEMFRWVGNMYREKLMIDKYEALVDFYMKDPLKPLEKLYKRPPVKHVLMVYGVDLPTEVGYTYKISDNNQPGSPILDEVFYEEPCKERLNQRSAERQADVTPTSTPGMCPIDAAPKRRFGKRWSKVSRGIVVSKPSPSPSTSTAHKPSKLSETRSGPDSGDDVCQNTEVSRSGGGVRSVEGEEKGGLSEEEEDEYEALLRAFAAAGMTSSEDIDNMSPMSMSDNIENSESHLDMLNARTIPINKRTELDEASSGNGAKSASNASEKEKTLQQETDTKTPVPVPGTPSSAARCLSEVYGVKTKKPSFTHSRRRFVRDGIQEHSGDATVPYVSLSFARTWLAENATGNRVWEERRPEYVHRGAFETWAPPLLTDLSITVDPPVDVFHSEHANGDTTVVMEVSRGDHLDIAKDPYVHFLMFDHLLTKMSEDLCLDEVCQQEEAARRAGRSGDNLSFLGRKLSEAASSMLEYLTSSMRPSVPTD